MNDFCSRLQTTFYSQGNTKHTQIVVAGGFSSGKSSFLNRLTNSANLLPTGVEPVSVVKTYLYCSGNNRSVSVRGVNLKNVLVDLEPGVLQAIQHAKQSHVYLASVLEKLFVEIPSKDLDGLVFIDTPGYNNSDRANQSNGKTDRDTAMEALSEGNVLFWLVDCERGTTVSDDIEMIKQFKGKKVIIFNKADKKGKQESMKIVKNAAEALYKVFSKGEIIDILAYSTLDNEIYYSINGKTIGAILAEVKQTGNGMSEIDNIRKGIDKLFDYEIFNCNTRVKRRTRNYDTALHDKNSLFKHYSGTKHRQLPVVKNLHKFLSQNRNEILRLIKRFADYPQKNWWEDAFYYDDLMNTDSSNPNKQLLVQCYYTLSQDSSLSVDIVLAHLTERLRQRYNEASYECEKSLKALNTAKAVVKEMGEYKRLFIDALDEAIRTYQRQNKARKVYDGAYVVPNVFESIQKEDYKAFLRSFENGVDLAVCNPNGYSPLTLAVQMGNNEMVKFMLDHDADPSIKDRRGYNAFHTAVENQYRDICKMLLDADPDLIATKTEKGETIEELARKQTFSKWIEQEIKNAF